jgi:hypothetical protein
MYGSYRNTYSYLVPGTTLVFEGKTRYQIRGVGNYKPEVKVQGSEIIN